MVEVVKPSWPKPLKRVKAFTTTRAFGVSPAPWDGLNFGLNSEDDPINVEQNRTLLAQHMNVNRPIQWLKQVHKTQIKTYDNGSILEGDGLISLRENQPCAVLTADCLSVFLCDSEEELIAVVHAGWRGLADGIVDKAIERLRELGGAKFYAAFGPCIGFDRFEVGLEVVDYFKNRGFDTNQQNCRYVGDKAYLSLYRLAQQRLNDHSVACGAIPSWCTYEQKKRFFSYRRDHITGRMASIIMRKF